MDSLDELFREYQQAATQKQTEACAEAIYQIVAPALWTQIRSGIHSEADAEDVMQSACVAIFESLPRFRGERPGSAMAFCRRVAHFKMTDYYRRKGASRENAIPEDVLEDWLTVADESAPFAAGEREELDYALSLLRAVKPPCVELLWDHHVLGFDLNEIADRLAISYDNARMQIARCLKLARSLVARKKGRKK